jgi:hypothetical protein
MKVTYRVHAVARMFERGITEGDVHRVLLEGQEIATYPEDRALSESVAARLAGRWAAPCGVCL